MNYVFNESECREVTTNANLYEKGQEILYRIALRVKLITVQTGK